MKKAILTLVCILAALTLCSCQIHIDTDPWPASPDYVEPTVTPPASESPAAGDPAPAETAPEQSTEENTLLQPVVTPEPEPADEEVVEPGING